MKILNLTENPVRLRTVHGGVVEFPPMLTAEWPHVDPRTTTRRLDTPQGELFVRQQQKGVLRGYLPAQVSEVALIVERGVAEHFPYRSDLHYLEEPFHTDEDGSSWSSCLHQVPKEITTHPESESVW